MKADCAAMTSSDKNSRLAPSQTDLADILCIRNIWLPVKAAVVPGVQRHDPDTVYKLGVEPHPELRTYLTYRVNFACR